MWGDAKFRRLSHDAQRVWFYLLTGPETTSLPGIIVAGPAALAEAIGLEPKAFREAFGEVLREGMAKADPEARLVWLPNSARYNIPESPNVVRSWRSHWDNVPECPLKVEAFQELQAFCEALGEGFAKAFREGCAQPSPNQEQEQEQEQEQNKREGPAAPAPAAPAPVRFEDSVEGRVWKTFLSERARVLGGKRGPELKLTKTRLAHLRARAKDSTEAELLGAVRALWSSEWHVANGQTDPDLVFRSRERVEKLLSRQATDAGRTSEAEHRERKAAGHPTMQQLIEAEEREARRTAELFGHAPPAPRLVPRTPPPAPRPAPLPPKPEPQPTTQRAPETEAERERRIEAERQRAVAALAAMAVSEVAQ